MNRRTTRETEMIRGARCRLQLSQQQVATLVGMPVRQYQRFEYGETEIQRINIRAGLSLCAVLELDPVSLVFNGRVDALSELAQQRPSKGKMQVRHKDIPHKKRSPKPSLAALTMASVSKSVMPIFLISIVLMPCLLSQCNPPVNSCRNTSSLAFICNTKAS